MATFSRVPPTIAEAALGVDAGLLSCAELTGACLRVAHTYDDAWGAYAQRYDDTAMAAARAADELRRQGAAAGPLAGVPLAVKDLIGTRERIGRVDAISVERLRAAGAIIVGSAATMEFGVGPPDSVVGPHREPKGATHNPWDPAYWTGGSSSGTACAVASGMALGGLGTDTGGSVRIPAALCGITGLKPTYGLIPKSGCMPLAYSLDHIGPMARTARDCALLLDVLAGPDPDDPASADLRHAACMPLLGGDLTGLRIGVDSLSRYVEPLIIDPAVSDVFAAALSMLAELGAELVPIELPYYSELTEVYNVTMAAEALAYHASDLMGSWHHYGVGTRTVIAEGSFYTAADYVQAQRIRRVGQKALGRLFADVDLVVTPTTSVAAPKLADIDRYYTVEGLRALHTQYWNSVGNPAVSVPMGFNADGLPLGLHIAGPAFADAKVLRAADAYQRGTTWHQEIPPLVRPLHQVEERVAGRMPDRVSDRVADRVRRAEPVRAYEGSYEEPSPQP